jgi:protein-S-isoprenylcysteine O-methyltransferase Ste14
MTDKTAEHALVLFLLFCGLLLIRIFSVPQFRTRYIAVFQLDNAAFAREIASLVVLTMVTMVLMPTLDLTTIWLDFADFAFSHWVAYAGIAIGVAAIALLWRTQYDWLRFFAGEGGRERSFIRTGIYKFIRHPFYTVLLLLAVAQMLMLQNWLAGPAAILTFLIVYLVRLPVDEQRAMEFYGHTYLDYMDRTNSLLPRIFRGPRDE